MSDEPNQLLDLKNKFYNERKINAQLIKEINILKDKLEKYENFFDTYNPFDRNGFCEHCNATKKYKHDHGCKYNNLKTQ